MKHHFALEKHLRILFLWFVGTLVVNNSQNLSAECFLSLCCVRKNLIEGWIQLQILFNSRRHSSSYWCWILSEIWKHRDLCDLWDLSISRCRGKEQLYKVHRRVFLFVSTCWRSALKWPVVNNVSRLCSSQLTVQFVALTDSQACVWLWALGSVCRLGDYCSHDLWAVWGRITHKNTDLTYYSCIKLSLLICMQTIVWAT